MGAGLRRDGVEVHSRRFQRAGALASAGGSGSDGIVADIGEGCYFGEVSLLLGCRRTASVTARRLCFLYALGQVGHSYVGGTDQAC